MLQLKEEKFWLIVGSQGLYGPEVLKTVDSRGFEMAEKMSRSELIPCQIIYKTTVTTPEEASEIIRQANYDEKCAGIIVWMHTFSPSKMWINGLKSLSKPYLHLHTQYNRNIPDTEIDMDFMNLNQAAHGDREHGFITSRLRLPRKIVVGYWEDAAVHERIGKWMRAAVGAKMSRNLKIIRFGDNMREVGVTEGDKIEAQIKLGWQVNTHATGDLVSELDAVTDAEIDALIEEYRKLYTFNTEDLESVRYQARVEIGVGRVLEQENGCGFTNTFQDLYGMRQLPGLASQRLMLKGYGFGGEGDWKAAAMTYLVKAMTSDCRGGSSFMEDYTYDLEPGHELSLGAHMLEVCPAIAADKPRIEVHPLGIGGKEPPARLVFEGKTGSAVMATLIDMGGRFRMIVHDIECVKPIYEMPNLPVARVMWRPEPNLITGAHAWILAGGAHHSVLSYDADAELLEDFCEIMGVEFVHIDKHTTIEEMKRELFFADLAWKLKM